jgi:hypothetical protein
METKADNATALFGREGRRVGCPEPGDVSFNTTAWKEKHMTGKIPALP